MLTPAANIAGAGQLDIAHHPVPSSPPAVGAIAVGFNFLPHPRCKENNMADQKYKGVKLTTPRVRASFPHLHEPAGMEGQEKKYSIVMLFPIGFIISMPSLSHAFQKAKGRLFPFGFIHILRALKRYDTLDFYLAGVKKEYRGKGVDLIMTIDIFRTAIPKGFRRAESNPELETNSKIQNEWKIVPVRQHKRRRIYRKAIG
jgi:hypothetical protein